MINIQLTPSEIVQGALIGVFRNVRDIKKGLQPGHGADNDGDWQKNVEGALGEMALAKYLGIYYAGEGEFKGPDVGDEECRTTHHVKVGHLLLHRTDHDHRRYWLMLGVNGKYRVRGFIVGSDGKKKDFWVDADQDKRIRESCFMVPQGELIEPHVGRQDAWRYMDPAITDIRPPQAAE